MAGVDPSSLHPTPVPVAHTPVSATLLPAEKLVGTKSHSPGVPKALPGLPHFSPLLPSLRTGFIWLGEALLSHPCKAAALDHLCRQAHGFLQHLGFLSRGCARAFLACRPALLPPPWVSASAQRGRELGSVPRQHRSASAQARAPSFPRSISFMLSTDKEEGPAVPAPANQRPKRSTQVRLPDRLSALPQHRPQLLRVSGCARAGDTTEPWSCWPCSPSLAAHCQPDMLPQLDPQLPSLPHYSGTVTGSCGGSLTALPLLLL